MKRVMIWCLLTEKRLIKKISYVVVLLMVPFLVWGLKQGSGEAAGVVTIGLCTDAKDGALSDLVIQKFMTEKSILHFLRYDSEEEGTDALKSGEVEALWIFPERLEETIALMVEKKKIKPVIRVLEREENVALTFTREALSSRVYPEFVYDAYVDYVDSHVTGHGQTSEELREIYDEILWTDSLFAPESTGELKSSEEEYYLAPIRGILAIWLVLAGFAALLYHKMDERNGVYDAIPWKKRMAYSFGLQGVVLFNCGIVYLIACKVLGIFTTFGREVPRLLLFLACIACFCNVCGMLIGKLEGIGAMIPFLMLCMLVLCPVFLELRGYGMVQGLLPPFYYLKSIYDSVYVGAMARYLIIGICLCVGMNFLAGKFGRKRS